MFSQYAAERKFADTMRGIFEKERATRKHLRLPYVAAMRRFEKAMVSEGYSFEEARLIAHGAIQVAELEFASEDAA